VDKFNRIEPGCFREHFFHGVCKSYGAYYPRLLQSLGLEIPSPWDPKVCDKLERTDANNAFLDTSILAARSCMNYTDGEKEEIWYSQGDIFSVFMALMHIETTIIRWDTNLNNFMDPNEVMEAYRIYSPALDGFLEAKPGIVKKFKKQIYQYMIKYEEVPDEKDFGSVWKFLKFLVSFNKSAPANRKTIASILHQISLQNAKMVDPKEPKFDCNWLRDPTNIPTGTDVPVSSNLIEEAATDYSSMLTPYLNLAN